MDVSVSSAKTTGCRYWYNLQTMDRFMREHDAATESFWHVATCE